MKKLLFWIIVLVMGISMVIVFSSSGCRSSEPPVEEPVAEEVTDEPEEEATDETGQPDESSEEESKEQEQTDAVKKIVRYIIL